MEGRKEPPQRGGSGPVFGIAGTHRAVMARKGQNGVVWPPLAARRRFPDPVGRRPPLGASLQPYGRRLRRLPSKRTRSPLHGYTLAELPGHGQFCPGWPTTSTHRALSPERGVHGLREVPHPCKYSMLFDGISRTRFGRKASMKPRGIRAGFGFHAPWLWPLQGHNGP